MRFKYRIKEVWRFLLLAFYPKITLFGCLVLSIVVSVLFGIIASRIPQESFTYNISFTFATGIISSCLFTFFVELFNNFKHNKLALYELHEYYSIVLKFENYKLIGMQQTSFQRAGKKTHEGFGSLCDKDEMLEEDKPKDIVQITWEQLPEMIPVFKRTLNDKMEFLSDVEIDELRKILIYYEWITACVSDCILTSSLTYDSLNHPDEDCLKSVYPSNVIKNIPEWIKRDLSRKESLKACDRYVEAILSDSSLLSQVMKNYEISNNSLDSLQEKLIRQEEGEYSCSEDDDYDDRDFYEPENEETFKLRNEEIYNQLEYRSEVSGIISDCCQNISDRIDSIEKCIQKKPYYGIVLKKLALTQM